MWYDARAMKRAGKNRGQGMRGGAAQDARGSRPARPEGRGRDREEARPARGEERGRGREREGGRGRDRDREREREGGEDLAGRLTEGIPAPFEVLYGMNPVREALAAGRRKFRRLLVGRREDSPEMTAVLKVAGQRGVEVRHVDRSALDALVAGDAEERGVQGIALVATPYRYYSLEEIAGPKEERGTAGNRRRLLALDEIEDPRNLGAMARTAEAAGFRGMILQEHRAAAATPTAVKSSAGAVEHLRIARETNLSSALERLKEHGYWIVGLDAAPEAVDIYAADLDMDLVLVVGAEGRGLRPRVKATCDLLVRLPMAGTVGSLNASAACAAAVYQVLRPAQKART